MPTLADISLRVARAVQSVAQGFATSSTPASLTDTELTDPNGYWDGGTIWFLSGSRAGMMARVLSQVPNRVTFKNIGAAPAANQVETLTVAGAVIGGGNATVTVTAAGQSWSPKAISVAVLALDDAAAVGGKVRTALAADEDVAAFFTVGGAGALVVLTAIQAATNDLTMSAAIDNGTCTGLTPATSANTTAGSECEYALAASDYPLTQIITAINQAISQCQKTEENSTLLGDGETLEFTLPVGVSNVKEVYQELDGDAQSRYPSYHWHELNGKLRFDNLHQPYDASRLHLLYRAQHPSLGKYGDTLDDELNDEWVVVQATFELLMWGKTQYEDDPEFDVTTKLQVCNDRLKTLAKRKSVTMIERSAGAAE